MEFKQLGICAPILKVLQEQSYITPTPIQEKTIPDALQGKDVLGLAQTGTGKTASFAIPILQILNESTYQPHIRALILTPTRELAIQVQESFTVYGSNLALKSAVIYGGVRQGKQVNTLNKGVDILVATPGRLMDLIDQSYIDISSIEIFVLDEADRMLDMGFIHDVRKIMKLLPNKKQTLLFSATMSKEIEVIANNLLVKPTIASVTPVSSTVDTIKQFVYFVDQKRKIDLLTDFFRENETESVLIFTRTKRGSDRVVRELEKRKITAKAIHGDKSQGARQNALKQFKNGKIQALIATDIASRGIDIDELGYVINYDLPEFPEIYVHRIGRTGRAGNEGTAISLCSFQEKSLLKGIEKLINKKIEVLENTKYPIMNETIKINTQQRKAIPKNREVVGDVKRSNTKNKKYKKETNHDRHNQEMPKNKSKINHRKAKRKSSL